MTFWTAESHALALPPPTYSPKIVKISLVTPGSHQALVGQLPPAVSMLSNPIFFPTTSLSRSPHLMYRDAISTNEDSYLHLVIGSSKAAFGISEATSCGPGQVLGSEYAYNPSGEKDAVISPPVVLRWNIGSGNKADKKDADEDQEETQTWRSWNIEQDCTSEDIKAGRSAVEELRILREDIVSGRKYHVPIRCGPDWTRQGFLSCS